MLFRLFYRLINFLSTLILHWITLARFVSKLALFILIDIAFFEFFSDGFRLSCFLVLYRKWCDAQLRLWVIIASRYLSEFVKIYKIMKLYFFAKYN